MNTKVDQMPFLDMVRTRTKQWAEEYDLANDPRLAEGVTMTMRNRGDYYGYFYNRPNASSRWRAYTGKGMVTYPIIGRSVRAKTATATSTKVQTEVEAVRQVPEKIAAADLARNILKYCREKLWTKRTEAAIAELCQLQRFCFTFNDYKLDGGVIVEIPETKKTAVKSGDTLYNCSNCGFQYAPEDLGIDDIADEFRDADLAESEADRLTDESRMLPEGGRVVPESAAARPDDGAIDAEYVDDAYAPDPEASRVLEHTADLPCPECGTATLVLDSRAKYEAVDALTGEYRRVDCGYMDSQIVSPLLIRLDTYPCVGFEYRNAGWFNYHPLVPAYEIIALAPHLAEKLHTGAARWSESARWHHELNNATSTAAGYGYRGKNYRLDELVEVNVWWVAPKACLGWSSPDLFELPKWECNDAGEWVETGSVFTIEADETIEAAFIRQFGSFRGMLLIMWEEELIGIGNEFFTEKWNGVPWKIDAQSFYPQGEENQLKLQDAGTNVLGMIYSHTRRRSNSTLVADPMGGFSEQAIRNAGSVPGGIMYRDKSAVDASDQDWKKFLGYLEPGEMSVSVFNFVQLIIEIAKEESGIFNETVGNVENRETLGGRRMALSQSLSLMTPTQQAKALALIENGYIWLQLWQKDAPDEAYTLIKGTFEEEWKPTDIAAFKALDIRRELFISIVEGTDVPRTIREQEEKFFMAVSMGLFVEPNPLPVGLRSYIIKSVLGLDLDIANYNAYKRLAARRVEVVKAELEPLGVNEAFTVLPDPSGFPVRQLRPEIVASIMQDPRTAARQTDEHLVFIEFYTDQINGIAGAKEPDEKMIAVLEAMISAHRAFIAANAVQGAAVQGIADASANIGGGMGALQGGGPEGEQPGQPGQPPKEKKAPAPAVV